MDNKKKLLFVIPNLKHGGAEKVLVNLVNNLNPDKYDISLFSIFDVGVNKQFLKPHIHYRYFFKYLFRGNVTLFNLFSPEFLYKRIIKHRYDIVISYLEGPATRIVSACPYTGSKKIAWVHTDFENESIVLECYRSLDDAKKHYEKFDRIVAVSKRVKEAFSELITAQIPIDVLYNTNETEQIIEKGKEPSELAYKGIKICSAGKVTDNKGFDRLLDVHKRLIDEGFPHHIYILGVGNEQEALEKKARELGVSDSFHFLGFHKNPYRYVSKCDLYVCSSFREGFSTAVTEALILGVPAVSTNCSGATELLGENNEYGIVCENSTEGIYQGMKQMLSQPGLLEHYKKQAELRGSFFSKKNTVKAVENLLDSLSNG